MRTFDVIGPDLAVGMLRRDDEYKADDDNGNLSPMAPVTLSPEARVRDWVFALNLTYTSLTAGPLKRAIVR